MKELILGLGLGKVVLYLLIINIVGFLAMGIDKWKAKNQKWRVPEGALLLSALLLGGPGALAGMLIFHHKTRKWKFRILVPLFTVLEIILAGFLLQFWK